MSTLQEMKLFGLQSEWVTCRLALCRGGSLTGGSGLDKRSSHPSVRRERKTRVAALSSGNVGDIDRRRLMFPPVQDGQSDGLRSTNFAFVQNPPAPCADIQMNGFGAEVHGGGQPAGLVHALHRNPSPRSGWYPCLRSRSITSASSSSV